MQPNKKENFYSFSSHNNITSGTYPDPFESNQYILMILQINELDLDSLDIEMANENPSTSTSTQPSLTVDESPLDSVWKDIKY